MRRIPVQPLDTDSWHRWIQDCDNETQATIGAVQRGDTISIRDLYKRKTIKNGYFFSKSAPFYGKCTYCECPITDFQHGDVEHFRPKAKVTDDEDRPVLLKDDQGNVVDDANGMPQKHPGYYWLAYDWRNLIPACIKCNQPSKDGTIRFGKHSRFPVIGPHAQQPGDERDEKPLLINPASGQADDEPEQHLFVELGTGFMGAKSDRGTMCIKIFGLNVRDQLVMDRKTAQRNVKSLLADLRDAAMQRVDPTQNELDVLSKLVMILNELIGIWNGQEPYTMSATAVLREKGFSLEWFEKKRKEYQEVISKVEFGGAIAEQRD